MASRIDQREWYKAIAAEIRLAEQLAGWRTFRVRTAGEGLDAAEVVCPASDEAGHKTTCAKCGLCGGAAKMAKSVAIVAHRAGKRNLIQIGV